MGVNVFLALPRSVYHGDLLSRVGSFEEVSNVLETFAISWQQNRRFFAIAFFIERSGDLSCTGNREKRRLKSRLCKQAFRLILAGAAGEWLCGDNKERKANYTQGFSLLGVRDMLGIGLGLRVVAINGINLVSQV